MTRKGQHVTDALLAYVDGELDATAATRVAEHLLACRACREECHTIRFAARAAKTLEVVPAPYGVFESIEATLDGASSTAVGNAAGPIESGDRWPNAKVWVAVAVMDLVIFGLIAWTLVSAPPSALEVTALEGTPMVEQRSTTGRDLLAVGEWLETDAASRARIRVADIGQVEIGPGSRVGLVTTGPEEHRLSLERGSMRAVVVAPPRLFLVDTPTATAVDYGCVYTLEVGDDSRSTLRVASGRVALERDGRDVMVPEGAMCEARKGVGVGTPVYEDASEAMLEAVRSFDFEGGGASALATILAEARPRDVMTLEAIAQHVDEAGRRLVLGRVEQLRR